MRWLDRWATSTEINQAGPPEGATHLRHTSCLTPIASMKIELVTSIPRGLATGAQPIEVTLGAIYIYLIFNKTFDILLNFVLF